MYGPKCKLPSLCEIRGDAGGLGVEGGSNVLIKCSILGRSVLEVLGGC